MLYHFLGSCRCYTFEMQSDATCRLHSVYKDSAYETVHRPRCLFEIEADGDRYTGPVEGRDAKALKPG